jgi:hypothetical protein
LSPGATWHWGAEAAEAAPSAGMGGSGSFSLSRRLGVAPAGTLPMALLPGRCDGQCDPRVRRGRDSDPAAAGMVATIKGPARGARRHGGSLWPQYMQQRQCHAAPSSSPTRSSWRASVDLAHERLGRVSMPRSPLGWIGRPAPVPSGCSATGDPDHRMHGSAGSGAKRESCSTANEVRYPSQHLRIHFGLPRAALARLAQLGERALLRQSQLLRDAAVRCDAVHGTCSMRSFPRDNVHAGRVVRSHKRRPTALLIAALSACVCEVLTSGTCGAQRLRMGYNCAWGTMKRVLTLSPARLVGSRPVRCDCRLRRCRPTACELRTARALEPAGSVCAAHGAHPAYACGVHASASNLPTHLPGVQHALQPRARSQSTRRRQSHAAPTRERRGGRAVAQSRPLGVEVRWGTRSTVLCAPPPTPRGIERASCDERQATCSRSACPRPERTSAHAPAHLAGVPHSAL